MQNQKKNILLHSNNISENKDNFHSYKNKLTLITFSCLEAISTFATISEEGVTNFVIVTIVTASELTVPPIFSRATC